MKISTLPGVVASISDSRPLASALIDEQLAEGSRMLDLCSGGGMLAVVAALHGATATAVDSSLKAVWTARFNARQHGVRVRALRGSLFEPVAFERFDCIVSDPPYGRDLLDEICRCAGRHLRPGGTILLTHPTLTGEDRTLALLEEGGLAADVIRRRPAEAEEMLIIRGRQTRFRGGD